MRLISARIRGYGRLADTKINLDSKLIAVVGPNEAGKTTLLKALAHVDSEDAVAPPERSRGATVSDDTTVVSLDYVLEDTDRAALADLDLAEPPQSMTVGCKAEGGNVTVGITPLPTKSIAPLEAALAELRRLLRSKRYREWVREDTVYADEAGDAPRDFAAELEAVADDVHSLVSGGDSAEDDLGSRIKSLLDAALTDEEAAPLREPLEAVSAWLDRPSPGPEARGRLWGRSPDLLLFDEGDRTLASAYSLDEGLIAAVPAALENLAGMAGLDLAGLHAHVQAGDIARRDTAIAQANTRLGELFLDAWKQSRLSVRLSVDGQLLRIGMWEDGDSITVFDERSAGLRMFVALIAFLKAHGSERPPILLIDEAENHLHIDAQADLVTMFANQDQAVKVIYTTHSPACLPPDLGSGIRTIVPRPDDRHISDVKNSFWQGAAGYSPLMLAMGAAAAAFTPARCVVLAEGATEMILLPTLIRAATDEASLSYQVAPGLSEVPKDFYSQLDLEGAKVAYLLDGDAGGDQLEKNLLSSGVPRDLVIRISAPGIENLLSPDSYKRALAALLKECNPGKEVPEIPELGPAKEASWSKEMYAWIEGIRLRAPSKVAVANWLIENGAAIPSTEGRRQLRRTHDRLLRALA